MKWTHIPDAIVQNLIRDIEIGQINQHSKTYVFKMADDIHMGIEAETELEARQHCDMRGLNVVDLVDIERPTFHGMSIEEIKAEAIKRGIEKENE